MRSPVKFFLLVFSLSVPFWLAGGLTDLQLIPGLSVSALMAFCPLAAALILTYQEGGYASATGLMKRSLDFQRIEAKRWYIPILLLMGGVDLVVYGLMCWMDLPLPAPQIQVPQTALMFAAFFFLALGEELGWSGYITGPLLARWSALQAGALLGAVGVLWHLCALLLMHRPPIWIAWWCLYAVAFRILIIWIFNNTGQSVFAVALFHATLNLSFVLFPVNGSYFDMRLGGLVMALTAAVVTLVWGPRTLARGPQA